MTKVTRLENLMKNVINRTAFFFLQDKKRQMCARKAGGIFLPTGDPLG